LSSDIFAVFFSNYSLPTVINFTLLHLIDFSSHGDHILNSVIVHFSLGFPCWFQTHIVTLQSITFQNKRNLLFVLELLWSLGVGKHIT